MNIKPHSVTMENVVAKVAKSPTPPKAAAPTAAAAIDAQSDISKLPEALRDQAVSFSSKFDKLNETDIRQRHELGDVLLTIENDTTGKYGDDPVKQMAKALPLSRDSLRPMMVLAQTYSGAELTELLNIRHPVTCERLTWTHVAGLTRVKDKAKAFELAEQAVAEGWTSRDLNRRIVMTHGGPKSKGGRKVKKTTTFRDTVADIAARSATWCNALDTGWLAPGGLADMYQTESEVVGFRPDQETATALDAVAHQLSTMQLKLAGLSQQLGSLKLRVDAARNPKSIV